MGGNVKRKDPKKSSLKRSPVGKAKEGGKRGKNP